MYLHSSVTSYQPAPHPIVEECLHLRGVSDPHISFHGFQFCHDIVIPEKIICARRIFEFGQHFSAEALNEITEHFFEIVHGSRPLPTRVPCFG
jgi:hypothetical protein